MDFRERAQVSGIRRRFGRGCDGVFAMKNSCGCHQAGKPGIRYHGRARIAGTTGPGGACGRMPADAAGRARPRRPGIEFPNRRLHPVRGRRESRPATRLWTSPAAMASTPRRLRPASRHLRAPQHWIERDDAEGIPRSVSSPGGTGRRSGPCCGPRVSASSSAPTSTATATTAPRTAGSIRRSASSGAG